ncbi:hypothetical protein EV702DRAFT_794981 [Suillus placidus]|uniref:Nephrocystin 3-like N-terminal domain-containing protein n=1 Tax=Suillus placidus TaxID=48579 RepID=A0A9P7CWT3_9AGAM|nr:hypothetical protein EV702DRAFT_794981 [Suillus placidus]
MENTRIALRKSITQVLDQHDDQMNIWLNGLAGVGKSTVAFTIAEEMKAAQRLVGTFFFSHKHTQKVAAIIPTIAYQLALAFPRVREDIVKAIENDDSLLSPRKSHADQIRELVIKPLETLQFRQEPYVIIIDALDECFPSEEAARLVTLLTDAVAGPDLPVIHVIFTSRPNAAAMPSGVHEILLTTRDDDTIRDVRFFLRASLDKTRTICPTVFGQPPIAWPLEDEFETLAFKAGGLFVYAAMAMNFISAAGYHPQERLELLLREKSTVGADIDQLYQQIIETSQDPLAYCRMLASIIHLSKPLSLAALQDLFHADIQSLAATLEAFSPIILTDGVGNVEIYHASLRDFMSDPLRSKQYHIDDAHAHEHLACCCLDSFLRRSSSSDHYPYLAWDRHIFMACPSSKLRNLLAQFADKILRHWVEAAKDGQYYVRSSALFEVTAACYSLEWIRGWSDLVANWRIRQACMKIARIRGTRGQPYFWIVFDRMRWKFYNPWPWRYKDTWRHNTPSGYRYDLGLIWDSLFRVSYPCIMTALLWGNISTFLRCLTLFVYISTMFFK